MNIIRFLFFILLVLPNISLAVCMGGNPSVAEELSKASLVFTGKVREVYPVLDKVENFVEGYVYFIETNEFLKGTNIPVAVVYSENSSGRFDMEVGKEYLLFTENYENPITINNCGNSALFSVSKETILTIKNLSK